jgi:hypothetical protein
VSLVLDAGALIEPGDQVLTSDPGDVALLLRCRRVPAEVKTV